MQLIVTIRFFSPVVAGFLKLYVDLSVFVRQSLFTSVRLTFRFKSYFNIRS